VLWPGSKVTGKLENDGRDFFISNYLKQKSLLIKMFTMKRILSVNNAAASTDMGLLIARIGIGSLMLVHGIPKMLMLLSGAPVQFPPVLGMSAEISLGLAVFAEVICSLFILAGFATRLAAVPLAITMLVAVGLIHAADPFTKQEPGLYYLLVYLVLFFAGSGRFSIDYLLQRKISNKNYPARNSVHADFAFYNNAKN
jgi:putative oxidoreductase